MRCVECNQIFESPAKFCMLCGKELYKETTGPVTVSLLMIPAIAEEPEDWIRRVFEDDGLTDDQIQVLQSIEVELEVELDMEGGYKLGPVT